MRCSIFALIALAHAALCSCYSVCGVRSPPSAAAAVRPTQKRGALLMSAAAAGPPEFEDEPEKPDELPLTSESLFDMSALSSRISALRESTTLEDRLVAISHAFVLVFDADTDDEAVYSMEMSEEGNAHVVLAFEDREDAEKYALSLRDDATFAGEGVASVQALDVEALVVTSRDADFLVGIVFRGDLLASSARSSANPLMITTSASERVSVSITMVPDNVFEGKSAEDFLDPSEDPVWVLVHDEGTGDAQYFRMSLNGTASVVCFKDEEAALRCGDALRSKGAASASAPSARSLLLEELLDTLSDDDVEVCLVDEVVEAVVDDSSDLDSAMPGLVAADASDQILGSVSSEADTSAQQSSVAPAAVRSMLDRLYGADDAAP